MDDRRVLDAYGQWIPGLAAWTHFATLTYAPPVNHIVTSQTWTRVGMQHAPRALRDWFHRDVRTAVTTAVGWFEIEFHQSGQPHYHGLLALGSARPRPGLQRRWTYGLAKVEVIDSAFSVARYVEKYAITHEARPPVIWGLPRTALRSGKDLSEHIVGWLAAADERTLPRQTIIASARRSRLGGERVLSQHLAALIADGTILKRKDGKTVLYALVKDRAAA